VGVLNWYAFYSKKRGGYVRLLSPRERAKIQNHHFVPGRSCYDHKLDAMLRAAHYAIKRKVMEKQMDSIVDDFRRDSRAYDSND